MHADTKGEPTGCHRKYLVFALVAAGAKSTPLSLPPNAQSLTTIHASLDADNK
jgi:hypothetical protein